MKKKTISTNITSALQKRKYTYDEFESGMQQFLRERGMQLTQGDLRKLRKTIEGEEEFNQRILQNEQTLKDTFANNYIGHDVAKDCFRTDVSISKREVPDELLVICEKDCPISCNGLKIKETCVLVYFPGLSMKKQLEKAYFWNSVAEQKGIKGNVHKYRNHECGEWYEQPYYTKPSSEGWYLVYKGVQPDSKGKDFWDQSDMEEPDEFKFSPPDVIFYTMLTQLLTDRSPLFTDGQRVLCAHREFDDGGIGITVQSKITDEIFENLPGVDDKFLMVMFLERLCIINSNYYFSGLLDLTANSDTVKAELLELIEKNRENFKRKYSSIRDVDTCEAPFKANIDEIITRLKAAQSGKVVCSEAYEEGSPNMGKGLIRFFSTTEE